MFGRWHAARSRRKIRRRVRAIAGRTSMIWLTEDGLAPLGPIRRGRCHICGLGRATDRDLYSGVPCCDHCGAAVDQVPGAVPRDGVAADAEHLTGECADRGCRSVGRPEVDARERERALL